PGLRCIIHDASPHRYQLIPYTTLFRSVVRRLKRWESIVAKLVRERSRLAEMEDTAGCRAILPTRQHVVRVKEHLELAGALQIERDRKSTRLNSSHVKISYAVFCLKKKK